MNKKFLNALLIGALVVGSMGTLTSCSKDYDGDINALKDQISKLATADQLASNVATLQASITAAQKTATDAATAATNAATAAANAQTTADKAASKASLDDAINTLTALINQKADQTALTKAVADLTKAMSDNYKTISDALGTKVDTAAYNKQIKELQAAIDLKANQSDLEKAVTDLNTKIDNKVSRDDLAAQIKVVNQAIQDAVAPFTALRGTVGDLSKTVGELDSRIKEVGNTVDNTLVPGLTALTNQYDMLKNTSDLIIANIDKMVTSVEVVGSTWPSMYYGNFDNIIDFLSVKELTDNKLGDYYAFVKNRMVTETDSILIRVNPTTATLEADSISLLNSKGQDLKDFVDIKDVKPYKGLLTVPMSRATSDNGLWKVYLQRRPFTSPDQVDAYKKAIMSDNNGQILFCVAVKSAITGSNRRVVSDYCLTVNSSEVNPIGKLHDNLTVGGKSIDGLRNQSLELEWNNYIAQTEVSENNTTKTDDRTDANRFSYLTAVKNEPIAININSRQRIKGFYVALDTEHATDAQKAEWSKWTITNVNTQDSNHPTTQVGQVGNSGSITITNMNGAKYGIVGLRVWAFNEDGTLVDPDGRAFYVSVGEPNAQGTLSINIPAFVASPGTQPSATLALSNLDLSPIKDATSVFVDHDDAFTLSFSNKDGIVTSYQDIAEKATTCTATLIGNATDFEDNKEYDQVYTYKNANGNVVYQLTVKMTKVLPTYTDIPLSTYGPKTNQMNSDNNYDRIFIAKLQSSDYGSFVMTNFYNMNNNFRFTFTNDDDKFVVEGPLYTLNIPNNKIDNKTEYSTKVEYNFGLVSSSTNGGSYYAEVAPTKTGFKTIFWDPFAWLAQNGGWAWDKNANIHLTYGVDATISCSKIIPQLTSIFEDPTRPWSDYLSNIKVSVNTIGGVQNEYFAGSYVNNGIQLSATQVSKETNPRSIVNSNLVITGTDCYGKTVTITLPIYVDPAK